VADLDCPTDTIVSKHHRYYARRVLMQVRVEPCEQPLQYLDDWLQLYAVLVARHTIKGIRAFSGTAFGKQLVTPGIIMLRATYQNTTVGIHLWYIQGDVAYSHLAAFSPQGYDLMCSYALYWLAIEYFRGRVRWLDIGAGAGVRSQEAQGADGLTQFKRGWATGARMAYFCGRVLDPQRYAEIVAPKGLCTGGYFPAYRKGEFG
jgi:hypothetical protein